MAANCPAGEIARWGERPANTFLMSQLESRARSRRPRTTRADERTASACDPAGPICFVNDFSLSSIVAVPLVGCGVVGIQTLAGLGDLLLNFFNHFFQYVAA